jgi:uncharacterized membrane protein YgcG
MRRQQLEIARPAFTLLEVLLASAIAVLLVGALYVSLTVELRQASEGREAVERATIARGIIHRLSTDLSPSITPPGAQLKFKGSQGAGGQGGSGSSGGSNSGGSGSGSSSSSSGGSSTGSSTDASSASATGSQTTNIPLQAGLIGTSDTLTIFVTRNPDPRAVPKTAEGTDSPDAPVPSDLRRISYWLGEKGLCRQEIPWVTGDQFRTESSYVIEDGKTEDAYLIAPEVTKLSFEYYDVSSQTDDGGWNDTWDGTQPGSDGATPMGPPTAIRVKFTIRIKDSSGQESTKDYSHVIALITASGPPTQDDATNTTGSDSSSGTQGQQGSGSSGSGSASAASGSGGGASSGSGMGSGSSSGSSRGGQTGGGSKGGS